MLCTVAGSTFVVVLTVRVLALRPLRRVMRVGFVVLVSTTLLLRRECISRAFSGLVFG